MSVTAPPLPCDTPTPVEWSYNPWRERRGPTGAITALAIGLGFLLATQGLGLLTTVVLLAALWALIGSEIIPARYRIDAAGVRRRLLWGWEQRSWAEFRRAVRRRSGVALSPYARPSWRDGFRASILLFPATEAERLRAQAEGHLSAHGL